MPTIKNRRGLDIPIHGAAQSSAIQDAPEPTYVALMPPESWGIKVRLDVQVGDVVSIGTPLFADRRDEAAVFGSPAAGTVVAIHRGQRRKVLSVVIEVHGESCIPIQPLNGADANQDQVRTALLASGLWPCLRQRPYDRVALSTNTPRAIVVQAHDSRPLAAAPQALLAGRKEAFRAGLALLDKLSGGHTFLCVAHDANWNDWTSPGVKVQAFEGPHPSGTPGLSIHELAPVGAGRVTWYIDAQDVADIGETFSSGRIPTRRVVALTGPEAKTPRLIATRRGAQIDGLVRGESNAKETRVLCGSVLEGRICPPNEPEGFLSRYTNQITLMEGGTEREFLSWALPVAGRYTHTNTMLDKFFRKTFRFNADENGSLRAIVPV
ncbi:MAG TPA: NADH:ubiquinone reductase (Na(+)-transporting) subunit A, partial [Planctomycetota bacterium]|nr:NADH:ubiquinone reductase (Na(+)-transporting) subunit A [Planctomycetota bacterium]